MISDSSSNSGTQGSFEAGSDFVENNGLSVRVLFISDASENRRTASLELKNTSDETIWLALIGPAPQAVDTSGNTYTITNIAGLASCKDLAVSSIDFCMTNRSNFLPGSAFSSLAANASSILNLTLQSSTDQIADTGFLSLTMSAALAQGDQPAKTGDRELIAIPISFPLISLEKP